MTTSRYRHPARAAVGVAAAASLAVFGLLALSLPGCGSRDDGWPKDRNGPKVVVSFAPLYCFAVNVAGDDAFVRNMMTTSGPHHFNPTDRDARLLQRADLFLVNGLGLEGDKPATLAKSSGNKRIKVVDLAAAIPQEKLLKGSCKHDHGDGAKHDHDKDPHVWLSPEYAILQVRAVRDALKEADPAHAAGYDDRADKYIAKLEQLTRDGKALFAEKKDRNIVTFHDSMTYFAKTFDLNIVGVVQKNPGTEPNGSQLAELIGLCADEKNPVRVITVEPQYGFSSSANEVVKELRNKGVPEPVLVEFDPLETVTPDELAADPAGWYERKMRANLDALAKAMK
jgi:zinc transport system substrate-binding protein